MTSIKAKIELDLKFKKMEAISFDKLLLKTAFCCMASDGEIDKREIELIKSLCKAEDIFKNFDFLGEINLLVKEMNFSLSEFINNYFKELSSIILSENEELMLINFAIETIKADQNIKYAEVKFFKAIRHKLKLSNNQILSEFPDIESFIREDIITETSIEKLINHYKETIDFPQFEQIK
jgi:hypothetical protein